jgi:hypothetical protein
LCYMPCPYQCNKMIKCNITILFCSNDHDGRKRNEFEVKKLARLMSLSPYSHKEIIATYKTLPGDNGSHTIQQTKSHIGICPWGGYLKYSSNKKSIHNV